MLHSIRKTGLTLPQAHRRQSAVRGSRGPGESYADADRADWTIPRMAFPTPWADPDALEREYQDALFMAEAAKQYALAHNFNAWPRNEWEGPALDIYTAARLFAGHVESLTEIVEARAAEHAASGQKFPGLSQRSQENLKSAAAEMAHALRVADALYQGVQDIAAEGLAEARAGAGSWDDWQGNMERISRAFSAAAEVGGEAAKEALEALAENAGKAARKGWEATFPWGPVLIGAAVIGGLALALKS